MQVAGGRSGVAPAPRQQRARPRARLAVMAAAAPKPVVMVNSCTGKMGRAVAEAATRAGLQVAPYTLVGAGESGATIDVAGQAMQLVGPDERDAVIERLKQQHPNLIVVDYTIPGTALRAAVGSAARRMRRCMRRAAACGGTAAHAAVQQRAARPQAGARRRCGRRSRRDLR
jgi:dihydrodipicolinate reductase